VVDPGKLITPVARPGGKGEPRDIKVQVRLTKEAVAYIDELAERQGQTRSDMLRILIRRGIGLRGESLDAPERSAAVGSATAPVKPVREAVAAAEPREDAPEGEPMGDEERFRRMRARTGIPSSKMPDPSDKVAYGRWLRAQRG